MTLEDMGWTPRFASHFAQYEQQGLSRARVCIEQKNLYRVLTDQGEMRAVLTGRMGFDASSRDSLPAVGDWVAARILDENPPHALIHAVLPRFGKFSRQAPGGGEQIVAANVDTVFITVGLDGNFSARRIERYLALAWESRAEPVVLLTKADLCDNVSGRLAEAARVAPGAPVYAVSTVNGHGMESVEKHLQTGRTVALLGSSGVGKSTIINHFLGGEVQRVNEVREDDSRGRHTTTHRQMFFLPCGALAIDTPGMRELQLWDADDGLQDAFSDIEALAVGCRFGDCGHQAEPGCAVRAALEAGELDPARFGNYLKMKRELRYTIIKQDAGAARAERAKWKKIHKMAKRLPNK